MKKIIVLVHFCFMFSLVYSQKDTMQFVQFFFADGNISSEGFMRENKPDGYWKTYWENGNLKSEGNRNNFLLDSTWIFYNSEGKIILKINYENNLKHGKRIVFLEEETIEENYERDVKQGNTNHYYPSGQIKKQIFFVDGLEEGYMKEYDENGIIITLYQYRKGFIMSREIINRNNSLGKKHGMWMDFFESGSVKKTAEWRNGILNGFVKEFDESGNLKSIQKFANGEIVPEAEELKQYEIRYDYYPGGKVKIVGSYRNDLPDGVRREFDENGKIVKGYIFRDGVLTEEGIIDEKGLKQGQFKEYFENGALKSQGEYKDSKPIGEWKYYYADGTMEQEGRFDSRGRHVGEWNWYYSNGNVWKTEFYENGLLEGNYIEYDISGKIIVKGEFFDGVETGQWFWEIGDTREEGNFIDGQYSGVWKTTDVDTEKTIFEGKYLDGYPNGKHTYYWPNGQKRVEGHYVMGQREGEWVHFDEEGRIYLKINYKGGIERRYDNVVIQPEIND